MKKAKSALLAMFIVLSGMVAGPLARADEDLCFDCLVRMSPESRDGEIVVCRPAGWAWGKKELKTPFCVVRLCGLTERQAQVLTVPGFDATGAEIAQHRFAVWDVSGLKVLADLVSGLAVTPAEAESAYDAQESMLSALAPEPTAVTPAEGEAQ